MNNAAPAEEFQVAVHDLPPEEAVGRLIDHAVTIQASDLYFLSNENHVAVHQFG